MKTGQTYMVHGKGIYDSDSHGMQANAMLVHHGTIIQTGQIQKLTELYPDIFVVDCSDQYILPGLVNTHVHLELEPSQDTYERYRKGTAREHIQQAAEAANRLLLSGVTLARDAGSSESLVPALDRSIYEDGMLLPRIQFTGMPFTRTGGHMGFLGKPTDTEEEIIREVESRQRDGCECIKIIASGGQLTPGSLPEKSSYRKEEIRLITDQAHKRGLLTAAHCLTTESFINAMDAGVDSIEHCACFVRNTENGLLERKMEEAVMNTYCGDHRYFMIGFSNHYHMLDHVREDMRIAGEKERFLLQQEEQEICIFSKLVELGLRPLVGTDAGCGLTYFDETWLELELLVSRCGMTAKEAIYAATVAGAEALGYGGMLGRLQAGYEADFITLDQNPLEEISAFRQVRHVVCRGKWVK